MKETLSKKETPIIIGAGVIIGIIPGTGASMASWFSYDVAKNMSRHKEEFGHGSGIFRKPCKYGLLHCLLPA